LEEKVQHFMTTGESPFAAHMEGGALWMRAKNTLEDVKEKHADIIKLERGISELADMFNDLVCLHL
jgi:t-SNARE complex subunit (syntaxin)